MGAPWTSLSPLPPPLLQEISFKNFYTAFLTVRIQQRKASDPKNKRWRTCVRDLRLMANPHTEDGSQDYVSLHAHQVRAESSPCDAVGWAVYSGG